jgi:catechol 2,3-dioxygenase-like lactoylglutathione lyase family enzyme
MDDVLQFDHAVLLMNDERRSRPFYQKLLAAGLDHEFVRSRDGRDFHRSFLTLGDGQGLALFEDRTPVPEPRGRREWPTVVFAVRDDLYDAAVPGLDGLSETPNLPGVRETFYTHDPEGNAIGLTRKESGPTTLSRLEVDVTSIEDGVRFYQDVLGLPAPETGVFPGRHHSYAWFRFGDQGVLLVEHPDAPGPNPGQHFAFLLRRAAHLEARERLVRMRVPQLEGHEGKRPDNELGTYVADPWGRKLQWITNPDTP